MRILPDHKPHFLNSREAAEYLSQDTRYTVTPRVLTVLRAHNRGPVCEKYERRRYYYTRAALDAYVKEWGPNPLEWFDTEDKTEKLIAMIEVAKSLTPEEIAAIKRTEGY